MTTTPLLAPPAPPSVWRMYRAMVGVGILCGLVIVTVFELTRPIIAKKRAEALERAIFEVLPEAASSRTFTRREDGSFAVMTAEGEGGETVHAGYDAAGGLVGFAVEGRGMGYQDTIVLLYGYDPDEEAIVGLRVLESKETPGLGDKIETDEAFQENFEALDVSLDEAGAGLAHPIVAVKQGEKEEAWQIDGITGATISSVALAGILDRSAGRWAPRIQSRLEDFRQSGEGSGR